MDSATSLPACSASSESLSDSVASKYHHTLFPSYKPSVVHPLEHCKSRKSHSLFFALLSRRSSEQVSIKQTKELYFLSSHVPDRRRRRRAASTRARRHVGTYRIGRKVGVRRQDRREWVRFEDRHSFDRSRRRRDVLLYSTRTSFLPIGIIIIIEHER